jgi:hypothetical protein
MLILHGQMTNLLTREYIHISSFATNEVFFWKFPLASIFALSTSEEASITACACDQEVFFCRKLANEPGFRSDTPTLLFEYTHGALCLILPGHFKGRSQHLDLSWKFIQDCIDNDVFKLVSIASDTMITDLGTVSRSVPTLQITTTDIYGDLASFHSVTLPLQPNTLTERKR